MKPIGFLLLSYPTTNTVIPDLIGYLIGLQCSYEILGSSFACPRMTRKKDACPRMTIICFLRHPWMKPTGFSSFTVIPDLIGYLIGLQCSYGILGSSFACPRMTRKKDACPRMTIKGKEILGSSFACPRMTIKK